MNFQYLPAQLMVLLLGWMFTLYLQGRSNHRAESIRRKDRIIDKLDELAAWAENQTTKENFSPSQVEESFSELLLHIELRMNHLNQHINHKEPSFKTQSLSPLRDVDFFSENLNPIPYHVHSHASHIIEDIEIKSAEIFFSNSMIHKTKLMIYEVHGILFGLISLALILFLLQHVFFPLFSQPT